MLYKVITIVWLSFLRQFKEFGACKTICGRLVKITQVSAPFSALHSNDLHSKDSRVIVVAKYFANITLFSAV